ncbi:MAG: efflux RND transporter periplasmic adaptor subunit, partial [Planctomycetota bacterium]|nr:efflux RND transporter periplasmic adaptor subunit [Planctomycetota bacterium]
MTAFRLSLLLGTLAALTACDRASEASQAQDPNLFRVKRDDLPIVVRENAELQALRETLVRSEVEGQSTIIYIIPEGSFVKQGDRLVELDVSELVEKRQNQGISVAKAEASLTQARKEKEILEKELTTKRNTAQSNLRITEMELEKLLGRKTGATSSEGKNGDMIKRLQALVQMPPAESQPIDASSNQPGAKDAAPAMAMATQVDPRTFKGLVDKVQELLCLDTDLAGAVDRDMGEMSNRILQQADKIGLAMSNLKIKETTFVHSRHLESKRFITRNELEKDQLDYQSQVSQVTLAWNDLDLLINYTLAKERIKLTQDRDNALLEVERVKGSNEAAVIKADSDLQSREMEYTLAKERLENLDRQINSAVILAPTPGTVVYARIDRNRGGGEAVREGVQVRERQELIILPDTTKMRCLVKVQEAQVDKVARGQAAFVTVEAFQGEMFTGRVTSVAPVADSNSGWMTSDRKVYTTNVELDSDNPDGRLRSRMASNVTIMIDTIKGTLPIPLQAVFRDRSVNYVWKQGGNGPVATPVKVGRQNTERVEVLDGVTEDDLLHLTLPAGVQPPKFEQPTAPEPAPMKAEPKVAAGGANGNGGTEDGQRPNRRGQGMGAAGRKKLAEMTPAEIEEYKGSLERMQLMVDGARENGNAAVASEMEVVIAALRKALDENDLAAGQVQKDKLS